MTRSSASPPTDGHELSREEAVIFSTIHDRLRHLSTEQVQQLARQICLYNDGVSNMVVSLSADKMLNLAIHKGTMPPITSRLLSRYLYQECSKYIEHKVVWDIGTGSGIQAIVALMRGANRVLCTDISRAALKNAAANINAMGLASRAQFAESDLFDGIPADEKCDILLFTPAYFCGSAIDGYAVSAGMLDNSQISKRFLEGALRRLNPGGVVFTMSWDFAGPKNCVLTYLKNVPEFSVRNITKLKNAETIQQGEFKIIQLSLAI